MIEVYQNEIHITKQETASISVAFYSDGTPVLLQAGDSIVFKLFSSPTSQPSALVTKTITTFIDGVANIDITSTDTNRNQQTYWYSITANLATGEIVTIIPPSRFVIV